MLTYLRVGADGGLEGPQALRDVLSPEQRHHLVAESDPVSPRCHSSIVITLCKTEQAACLEQGTLLLLAAGDAGVVNKALDRVRRFIAPQLFPDLERAAPQLLWVIDFPMFEWNAEEQRLEVGPFPSPFHVLACLQCLVNLQAMHHPFTAPKSMEGDLRRAVARAYDLVYNGVELGGRLSLILSVPPEVHSDSIAAAPYRRQPEDP